MADATRLDSRGLPCPRPVVLTRDALRAGALLLHVIVDDGAPRENVARMARSLGCTVEEQTGEDGVITLVITAPSRGSDEKSEEKKKTEAPTVAPRDGGAPSRGATVVLRRREMGGGDQALGYLLMRSFLTTLKDHQPLPERIILYNAGVHLAAEGAETLPALAALAAAGVEVVACGTCLDFYHLKEHLAVGRVTTMLEIVEFLDGASRIVSP